MKKQPRAGAGGIATMGDGMALTALLRLLLLLSALAAVVCGATPTTTALADSDGDSDGADSGRRYFATIVSQPREFALCESARRGVFCVLFVC